MENSFDKTATETINLLEARLRRIEYVVHGHEHSKIDPEDETESATTRLANLERALHGLAVKSKVIKDLLQLHTNHPSIFHNTSSTTSHDTPTNLSPSMQQSIILASASSYNFTASSLTSVMDVPIPPTESSLKLIQLEPRLAKVKLVQEAQKKEMAELRERTVEVLRRWYTLDVVGVGDFWAEIEGRVGMVERGVRRAGREVDGD